MEGTVSTYLPSKGYGFVKGDDGRDYFLHCDDVPAGVEVAEGLRLIFEEAATPKGYRARRASVGAKAAIAWELPTELLTSKTGEVKGWDVIEPAAWMMTSSSRESPDDARDQLQRAAMEIGATGIVQMRYFKSRGSEAGTGRGTHHFTIHHFAATPVMLARKTYRGGKPVEDLTGLNRRLRMLKEHLEEKTRASTRLVMITALTIAVLIGSASFVVPELSGVFVLGALLVSGFAYFAIRTDHDSWLQAL